MKEYQAYLSHVGKSSGVSLWQIHQSALSRAVAEEYGLTREEILWPDENL